MTTAPVPAMTPRENTPHRVTPLPVVAPLIGGFLADPIGWRGILWVVFGLVALMVVATIFIVPESHPREPRAELRSERAGRGSAARDLLARGYLGYTAVAALCFAVLMGYVAASPFLYQTMMGLDALQYGLLFGANAVGLTIVSALSSRLARRFALRSILAIGLIGVTLASLALLLLAALGAPPILMAVALFVAVSALGLALGNTTSLALAEVPKAAGTGSALLGALQFGLGAAVSPVVGLGGEHTALPLAIVMVSAEVATLLALLWARPRHAPVAV